MIYRFYTFNSFSGQKYILTVSEQSPTAESDIYLWGQCHCTTSLCLSGHWQSLHNMTWAVSRCARLKTLQAYLNCSPLLLSMPHVTLVQMYDSAQMLALLHFAFHLFLLKHNSQDHLTPHEKSLATPKLRKSLPKAASNPVPECPAALLWHPGILRCWLWNSFCG